MKRYLLLSISLWIGLQSALMAGVKTIQPSRESTGTSDSSGFHDPFDTEEGSSKPTGKELDSLEPMNRFFFKVNDRLYFWLLKPVSKGLATVVPKPCREALDRAFLNAKFPIRFVNNLLQGKLKGAGYETGRLVVNTTVGFGGLFDPAARLKLNRHPADFDQTLAKYKIPTGSYLCWPVIGPSSVRGTVGEIGDTLLTPWTYLGFYHAISYGLPPTQKINTTSLHLGEYEDLKKSTFDPYIAVRSAYFDSRRKAAEN